MPLRHMVAASVIRAYAQHAATSSSPDPDPEAEGPYPAALVHPAMGLVWVALLLVFLAMTAIVCDHYMVPTLVKTCDHFGIPEEAAGSTVFAFASAAMDIFFSLIETAMGEPGIGLSYILGAGIIAFGVVPSVVVLVTPGHTLVLELWPVCRDSAFCITAFAMLLYFLRDQKLHLHESASLVTMWMVHILVVYVPFFWIPIPPKKDPVVLPGKGGETRTTTRRSKSDDVEYGLVTDDGEGVSKETIDVDDDAPPPQRGLLHRPSDLAFQSWRQSSRGDMRPNNGDPPAAAPPPPSPKAAAAAGNNKWKRCLFASLDTILKPFTWLFTFLYPHAPIDVPYSGKHMAVLWLSLFYMLLMTLAVVKVADLVTLSLGIPLGFAAAIVLPMIYMFPDGLASVGMARAGLGQGAIANAMGAQIVNVFLGVGLPFLLWNANHVPHLVSVSTDDCDPSLRYGVFVLGFVLIGWLLKKPILSAGKEPPEFDLQGGILVFGCYVVITVVICVRILK